MVRYAIIALNYFTAKDRIVRMKGFLYFAKAASILASIALGSKPGRETGLPVVMRTSALGSEKLIYLPISAYDGRVHGKYFSLVLSQNKREYRAVILTNKVPQDIMIPSYCNGLPVTEIEWKLCVEYENKVRLFVPKTVKKLDLNVVLHSGDYKRIGRWIKIIIDEQNPYLITENRCVYSKDMTVLWCALCKTNYFTVPDTVTRIADHAFTGNMYIVEVKLPPSVKVIGKSAFEFCKNLRSINVENVESIGEQAFFCCIKIRDLICEKLHDIGDRCFDNCRGLDTIKLPATLTTIGTNVFPETMYIMFYDNLKAPLRSFVDIPYFVTVRSAQSGAVKYKVCIDHNAPRHIQELYLRSWGEYAEFDFEGYDKLFADYCSNNRVFDKYFWITAQLRLGYPYKLSDSAKEYYKRWLKDNAKFADWYFYRELDTGDFSALCRERIKSASDLTRVIYLLDKLNANKLKLKEHRLDEVKVNELKEKIFAMIEEFCRDGVYGVDDLIELIENFSANGRTEYTARMMELRNSMFPYQDRLELE